MQKPDFTNSKLRQACRSIVNFTERGFARHILRHLAFVLPPAAASYIAFDQSHELLKPFGTFGELLTQSSFLLLVLAWIWVILLKELHSALSHFAKPEQELTRDDLVAILQALYKPVSKKVDRMRSAAQTVLKTDHTTSADAVFKTITQPLDQMKQLTESIHELFQELAPTNSFWKTRLYEVTSARPSECVAYYPSGQAPTTSLEALGAPTSTISRCISSKQLQIVEDIPKELSKKAKRHRRCIKGSSNASNGAIICAPILHPVSSEVVFVLCITSDETLAIKESLEPYYRWLLDHFFARFMIETSLLVMRRHIEDTNEQAA